jgi:hypothetical protein
MKTLLALLALLALAASAFAQSGPEPAELAGLRASWTKAREQATRPIDEQYSAALAALKDRFTKAGNLEAALQVDKELRGLIHTAPAKEDAAQQGAAIRLATTDKVRVIALKTKQPRLYDANPVRTIDGVSPKLAGWKFTSVPQRLRMTYDVEVEHAGSLYCFGAPTTSPVEAFGADAERWKREDGTIHGLPKVVCYQRTVAQGEKLHVEGFELSLAAKEITSKR